MCDPTCTRNGVLEEKYVSYTVGHLMPLHMLKTIIESLLYYLRDACLKLSFSPNYENPHF